MAAGKQIGKIIVLLLLILVVAAAGLVWFDYLGVIDAKGLLAPVYTRLRLPARTQPAAADDVPVDIDAERLAVRLEAIALQQAEMDKQKGDIEKQNAEIEQKAAELEARQKTLDDREATMNAEADAAANHDKNIEQIASYLNGMPPAAAVAIIEQMDDQDAIAAFRKLEQMAAASGTASTVSYWLSLMQDKTRAATLLRKMQE